MYVSIYGGDSETYEGLPHTFQFYSEHDNSGPPRARSGCADIIFVDETNAFDAFLDWCEERQKDTLHVVYVHNLKFDLPEFFWNVKHELAATGGAFEFDARDWHIKGVYGGPYFAQLYQRNNNRRIYIVDSMLWYQGSLASAADLFCPDLPKLKRPKKLGQRFFKPSNDEFVDYAMRDAEVAYHIGCAVQKIHDEFEIRQAVSLADMSCKIFRHRFLTYTIPQPSHRIQMAALASYHGGKNYVQPDAYPAWHSDITAWDISSAYPFAMESLPSFENPKAYHRYGGRTKGRSKIPTGRIREVPNLGVYRISGTAANADGNAAHPVIFDHSFQPIHGRFANVWVQGFELNEALRSEKVKLTKLTGYYYDREKDHGSPALREFVRDFYGRKQSETDPVLRFMYKIVLNALYGKFIQTRKTTRGEHIAINPDDSFKLTEQTELVAGGMCHPFIASAITAHTRAYIHQLEHEYKALHTATDGILTKYHRKRARVPMEPASGLGTLECEAKNQTLLLIRNKCYILYGDKQEKGGFPSRAFKGKFINKRALHGFQGSVFELERLVLRNRRKYTVTRPVTLKQGLKSGQTVNKFVDRDMVLKVGPISVR